MVERERERERESKFIEVDKKAYDENGK
jgi:hypothetical protein